VRNQLTLGLRALGVAAPFAEYARFELQDLRLVYSKTVVPFVLQGGMRASQPGGDDHGLPYTASPAAAKESSKNRGLHAVETGKRGLVLELPWVGKDAPARYGSCDALMKYARNSSRTIGCGLAHEPHASRTSNAYSHAADDVPLIVVGAKRANSGVVPRNRKYPRQRCQSSRITVTGPS